MRINIIRNKFKNNYWAFLLIISGLIIPNLAHADGMMGFAGQMIAGIVYYLMIYPLGLVLKLELWILPMIAQYNNFIFEQGVINGWIAMRDLSNMLFIIVFLVIAFATILKIKSYGYEALLKKFLILAILINFSKTIVGFVIDIFQIVMLTFVAAIKDIAAGNIAVALGMGEWGELSTAIDNASGEQLFIVVTSVILMGIMLLITVMVIAIYITSFASRIVQLWILIVLSPMAFFANVFPGGKKYFDQWLSKLSKELIKGPLLAFFLWLSFSIVGAGDISDSMTSGGGGDGLDGLGEAHQPNKMINFVIGIAMLMGSLQVASEMGMKGAAKVSDAIGTMGNAVKKKALDKVKGGARMLYSGTSGEGMFKGGGSRATSWGKSKLSGGAVRLVKSAKDSKIGKQVAGSKYGDKLKEIAGSKLGQKVGGAFGKVGESLEKVEMRAKAKENSRRRKKTAYVEEKAKAAGITDSDMGDYLEKGLGVGPATKLAISKDKAKNNNFKDSDEAQRVIEDLGAAGETELVEKIRQTRADTHTPESAEKLVKAKGVDALKGFDDDSMAQNGELTEGAKEIVGAILANKNTSSEDFLKSIEKLSGPMQKAIKEGMSSIKAEGKVTDKDGGIDKESAAGKKAIMQLNDPKQSKAAYKKLTAGLDPAAKKDFDKSLGSVISSKSLAKMAPKNNEEASDMFKAAIRIADPKDTASLTKEVSTRKQKELIVELQVTNDDGTTNLEAADEMLHNTVTRDLVSETVVNEYNKYIDEDDDKDESDKFISKKQKSRDAKEKKVQAEQDKVAAKDAKDAQTQATEDLAKAVDKLSNK